MLVPLRIEVERGRIRDVTACVIRYHRDVISDLILVRITFERIKRVTHSQVRRPGKASIRTIGVEQLGIGVIRRIACVVPDSVQPPIRRH